MTDVNLTGEAREAYIKAIAKKSVNLSQDERMAFMDALMRESAQATEAKQNRVYSQCGDDYLIEAQKVCAEDKPKPPVVCPYCGHKMGRYYAYDDFFFRCPKCRVASPDRDTEAEAYAAAMQRWQEPNDYLVRAEVLDRCKQGAEARPLWVEFRRNDQQARWMVVDTPPTVFGTDTVKNYFANMCEQYGIHWRCWLRKPTQEEMEAVPWEGD